MAGLFGGFKMVFARLAKRTPIQRRFAAIPDFRGLDYESIFKRIGIGADETQLRSDGQTARTWLDGSYSITLLFNSAGLCLGVEEERI